MARYRLKYCLEGLLSPKQPTNQITLLHSEGPKLYGVLTLLNAIGLKAECLVAPYYTAIFGFVSCIFVNKTYRDQTVFIGANISMIDHSKLEKSVQARFKMWLSVSVIDMWLISASDCSLVQSDPYCALMAAGGKETTLQAFFTMYAMYDSIGDMWCLFLHKEVYR